MRQYQRRGRRRPACRCGECSRCHISAGVTRAYREGRKEWVPRPTDWSPAEDKFLREWIGRIPHEQLSDWLLEEDGGRKRTIAAIRYRARQLGLSSARRVYTARGVSELFGVHRSTVVQWVARGWLTCLRHSSSRGSPHLFDERALERFIRGYPWAYDPQIMLEGRFRRLAEVQDKYLSLKEAAWALHVHPATLRGWLERTEFPFRLAGHAIRIRARDLPSLARTLAGSRWQAHSTRGSTSAAV